MKHKGCLSQRTGIDNEVLCTEYVTNKLNVPQIAAKYGWCEGTIKWRLKNLGVYENDTRRTRTYTKRKEKTEEVNVNSEVENTEADEVLSALGL